MYSFVIDKIVLPLAPSSVTTSIKGRNEIIDLVSDGEVNILRSPALTEISFEILLPGRDDFPAAEYPEGYRSPDIYISILEKLKIQKKPCLFSIVRKFPDGSLVFGSTPMMVSLENYEVIEDAENGFDVIVSVDFKRYKEFGTKQKTIKKEENQTIGVYEEKTRKSTKEMQKNYAVKQGDTLWKICQLELGDGEKYREIAQKNNISNPNVIKPGQVIRLA